MRSNLGIVLSVLTLAACGSSPEQTVVQLGTAFRVGDRLGVESRMDVQRVAEAAVNQVVEEAMRQTQTQAQNSMEAAGAAFGAGLVGVLKPTLTASLSAGIRDVAAGRDLVLPPLLGSPGDTIPRASIIGAFRGVRRSQVSGSLALVAIAAASPSGDDSLEFELRLEKSEGSWKVVGVEGLGKAFAPRLLTTQRREAMATVKTSIRNAMITMEAYFSDHGAYPSTITALTSSPYGFTTPPAVAVTVDEGGRGGFRIHAVHTPQGVACDVQVGLGANSDTDGVIRCR